MASSSPALVGMLGSITLPTGLHVPFNCESSFGIGFVKVMEEMLMANKWLVAHPAFENLVGIDDAASILCVDG